LYHIVSERIYDSFTTLISADEVPIPCLSAVTTQSIPACSYLHASVPASYESHILHALVAVMTRFQPRLPYSRLLPFSPHLSTPLLSFSDYHLARQHQNRYSVRLTSITKKRGLMGKGGDIHQKTRSRHYSPVHTRLHSPNPPCHTRSLFLPLLPQPLYVTLTLSLQK
jgi:hypothetical protein